MRELHLLRKVAVGSAVDAFLAENATGTVVVQLSHPEITSDPELHGRFLDATRSAAQTHRHPALLGVAETHCDEKGRFVVVSGPASGRTAADHLNDLGPISGSEVKRWALRLVDALEFLHAHGLVHGHLSPRNVFLDGDLARPDVRLLDTALLLFRGTRSVPVSHVLVPPEYLSPERCSGRRATPACDVYGLGVLIHELLTGDPPFTSRVSFTETRTQHLTAPLPPLLPGLEEWEGVVRRCLSKNPLERYSLPQLRAALFAVEPLQTPAIVSEPAVEPPTVDPEFVAAPIEAPAGDDVGRLMALVDEPAEPSTQDLGPVVQGTELPAYQPGGGDPSGTAMDEALERALNGRTPRLPVPAAATDAGADELQAFLNDADVVSAVDERPALGDEPVSVRPPLLPEVEVGDVLGKYRLDRLLGEGGMGQVFEATNLMLRRKVALKLLRRELSRVTSQVHRFVAEAQAVNRVKHPNIIAVEDLVNDGDRVYFVMELLEGRSLKGVARETPVELRRIVRWIRQAAEALAAAHAVGVIHRDLKPDNLMLIVDRDGQEQLKVLDFGVARIKGLDPSLAYQTQVGQVVGTPLWMAPEQVLGHEVDPRADVYSLAMVAYVLMLRRFPFEGDLSQVVMSRLAREARPVGDATFLGEVVPKKLRTLLESSLARDRGHRPSSMEVFAKVMRVIEEDLGAPQDFESPRRSWWKRWQS